MRVESNSPYKKLLPW